MTTKDFKVLLNSTNEDFKLVVKVGKDTIEIDNFELNFKNGYMIINTKTTSDIKI